jgi:hypothetical protein
MHVLRSGERLAKPRDLRAALGLTCVPDDTTPDRVLRRLDDAVMAPALSAALRQLPAPPEERGTAVDATGGASGAICTFVVKRAKDLGEGYPRRHWLQWTVAVNSGRRLVVAQVARHGLYNAGATPRPLLDAVSGVVKLTHPEAITRRRGGKGAPHWSLMRPLPYL